MERSENGRVALKNFKIIVGVLLIVTSLMVFSQMAQEHHGAGLLGVFTGSLLICGIGVGLVYSTQYKRIKEDKKKNKIYYEERKLKEDLQDKIQKLKNLRDKDILSESEYLAKINDIKKTEIELQVQKTEEYKELQYLYQSGVLIEKELESKLNKLRKQYNKQGLEHLTHNSEKPNYAFAGSHKDGLAKIRNQDLNYGFVDRSGNIVIDMKYEFAEDFSEELAVVRLNGKFGFVDRTGKTTISFIYDDAASFLDGRAEVRIEKKIYKINKLGFRV